MFFCKKVFFLLALSFLSAFATHVAVLETTGAQDIVTFSEKQYLTDVLRSEAVKILPAEQNYTIMTRENINAMLPPGKALEDCEGSCIVETGKNISADYVAQGHVGKFADNLTITVELYETAGNKLLGSFSSKALDVESLELEIRQKSQELFTRIVANSYGKIDLQPTFADTMGNEDELVIKIDGNISKNGIRYARGEWSLTPGDHSIEFLHRCYDSQQFTVNVLSGRTVTVTNRLDATLGMFSITTAYRGNLREVPVFVNGVLLGRTPLQGRIPVCAHVVVGEVGYQESIDMEWGDKDKLEISYNLTRAKPTAEELRADSILEAERFAEMFAADEAARVAQEKEKRAGIMKTTSFAMFFLGLVSVGVGVYENMVVKDERRKYEKAAYENAKDFDDQWDKVKSAVKTRNIFYGVGAGLIGAGSVIYFVF